MYRTALRNVLAHKARLLMTALAVLLGTAFVAGTLVFTDTLGSALKSQNAKSFTDIAVSVSDDGAVSNGYTRGIQKGVTSHLTEQTRQAIAALPGTAEARGVVSGFAGIADRKGALIGDGFSTTGTNYVPDTGGRDTRYPLAEGQGPQHPDELALDTKTAQKGGYRVGDTVRVAVNGPVLQLKLTGLLHVNDPRVTAGGSLAAFDTATAQRLYLTQGQFNEIDVRAKPGTDDQALLVQVRQLLPTGGNFTAQTGRELAAEQDREIAASTKSLSASLLVFAGISLFVGVFIIANTFSMLVAQRTKELALLRAIGASRRQITRSVLIEALLVGLLASAGGLLAGVGIADGLRAILNGPGQANLPDGPLIVALSTVASVLAVGVLVTVLAAWLPARRAGRIAPVAAMSNGDQPATQKSLVIRNTIGLVIGAAGSGLLVLGASSRDTDTVGLGAGALLIGVFILTPLLSRPLIALLAPLLQRIYGSPAKLARENALRNPRRTAATASALTIGVTLITALTVVGASVNRAVDRAAGTDLKADYEVAMQNFAQLAPAVGPQIAATPGVSASSVLRQIPVQVGEDDRWITGVNPEAIGQLASLTATAGSLDALTKGQLLVDQRTAKDDGLSVGDTFTATYPDTSTGQLTIGGIVADNSAVSGLLAPDALIAPHSAGQGPDRVLVKGVHGADPALKQALKDATGGNPLISVKGQADLKKENRQMLSAALSIMYGLLGMSVVIAVLGVVNTMAMAVFERRREIGMLRAVGLDRRGVRRMVRLESLLIALLGGLLGVALGILTGWAGNRTISGSFKDLTTVVPPLPMLGFVAAAAVVGLLAALWPARRAARLDVLDSIRAS
ncbi:ABC transporter permease [Kitasatospora kifunensis]|uniref:Putative ABC transport system permease protein n=1 Tax=Kitasatospora kifunensis TaxID=58351 RepID=A0A7W7R6Z5_KITKI|nr:FtsX-like permease family protein [Kitasatospora kifunensis]MBB4926465.1 putative ABC transport system permease protein [Kitasatospora kifunensis]